MSPRSVLSAKWIGIACVFLMRVWPSLQAAIIAPDAPATICDARQFRQAIVSVCTFHRRDIHPAENPDRYLYNVNEKESGGQSEHAGYGKLVFTQLGKETLFFPVQPGFLPVKVKRHREFALHRKCCLNGCTALDFAGVC